MEKDPEQRSNGNARIACDENECEQKYVKKPDVVSANAVGKPQAVVVFFHDAVAAVKAMPRAMRLEVLADVAVFLGECELVSIQ